MIASRVLRYVGDGAIIDLHDGNRGLLCACMHEPRTNAIAAPTSQATRLIVDALKREGYQFVTIPELLRMQGQAPDAYAYSLPCKRMNPSGCSVLPDRDASNERRAAAPDRAPFRRPTSMRVAGVRTGQRGAMPTLSTTSDLPALLRTSNASCMQCVREP